REGGEVAAALGTTAQSGAAATSAALFAAAGAGLLHLAVHAELAASGGALALHDRAVPAAEISARALGPAIVVLSACSSADARDPESAGSLAAAFLAGGARQVVATLGPVSDAGGASMMRAFYQAGGRRDPVRALAAVQASLAATGDAEWPRLAVFGHDTCT